MPNPEFIPLTQTLDRSYCQELLEDGIMPAAVVCIAQAESDNIYSVIVRNRLSGLPIIDLAGIKGSETPEHYTAYRLRKRFDFRLPKGTLQLIPVESNDSAYINDIGNPAYPTIHSRIYFPIVGRTDVLPGSNKLRAVSREEVLDDIASPQGGDALYQLIDIHRELLFSYSW